MRHHYHARIGHQLTRIPLLLVQTFHGRRIGNHLDKVRVTLQTGDKHTIGQGSLEVGGRGTAATSGIGRKFADENARAIAMTGIVVVVVEVIDHLFRSHVEVIIDVIVGSRKYVV